MRPASGVAYLPGSVVGEAPAPLAALHERVRRAFDPQGSWRDRATSASSPRRLRPLRLLPPDLPHVPVWSEEMDSPRGRIQLMEAHLDGTIALNPTVAEHFDRCLGCMACVTSCPSGVRYDLLIAATRERVETRGAARRFGDRFCGRPSSSCCPTRAACAPRSRLAPLGRKVPLPGRLGAMTRDRTSVALDREARRRRRPRTARRAAASRC